MQDAGAWAGIFTMAGALDDMPDKAAYGAAGGMSGATPFAGYNWISGSFGAVAPSFDLGVNALGSGLQILQAVFLSVSGQVSNSLIMWQSATSLAQGTRVVMKDGSVYVSAQAGADYFIRWPDDTTDLAGPTAPASEEGDTPYNIGEDDSTPPVVTLVSPQTSQRIGRQTPIIFDVTDETSLATVFVSVAFPSLGTEEVAYRDGQATTAYEVTIIGNRYTVRRRSGWPANPEIVVTPVDRGGNLAAGFGPGN